MSLTARDEASKDSAALNERLLEVLKEAVGRSTSARSLSEELGHAHNYVRRLLSGEIPLQMETLLNVLGTLGFPPELFFDQVFQGRPSADPVAVLKFYREGDGLPRDPFLDEIEPRIESLLERTIDSHAEVESWSAELEHLEEQRMEDREGAKEALETLARTILDRCDLLHDNVPSLHVADLARALSIWAVIQRVSGYRDNSCDMYVLAFKCIRLARCHLGAEAECFQRAAYLLRDLDEVKVGLQFLGTAKDLFLRAGDLHRVGKVLVDHGVLLGSLSEMQQAAMEFQAALKILPRDSVKNRAVALHGLAYIYEEENRSAEAINLIREACELCAGRTDIVAAQSLVIRGRIARRLDLESESEKSFLEAMTIYRQAGDPLYVILAGLEYAGLLLMSGRVRELASLGEEMFALGKHFRKNRLMDAALMEFVRTVKWGELTEELLEETKRRLEAASESPVTVSA